MAFTSLRFRIGNRDLENAAMNNPPLKRGARGEAVKVLQQALHDVRRPNGTTGYPMPESFKSGGPDGDYGRETYLTVLAFQKEFFPGQIREHDGQAGKHTLEKLDSLFAPSTMTVLVPGTGEVTLFRRENVRRNSDFDYTFQDYPPNRLTPAQLDRVQLYLQVPDTVLEQTLILGFTLKTGALGETHIRRFMTPSGAGMRHEPGSQMSTLVRNSLTFQGLLAIVTTEVGKQVRDQAGRGSIDPSTFSIAADKFPRETKFREEAGDGPILPAIIGGVQGLTITLKNFAVSGDSQPGLPYTATLRFDLTDMFGFGVSDLKEREPVDSLDRVIQGARAAWVLQHDNLQLVPRSVHRPFLVRVLVEVPLSGRA